MLIKKIEFCFIKKSKIFNYNIHHCVGKRALEIKINYIIYNNMYIKIVYPSLSQ